MKQFKRILGVTLLEIMLVLAIAALIIIMSVRYFQSASVSQQATAFLSELQAIVAAENSASQGNGAYPSSAKGISGIIPAGGLTPPWGDNNVTIIGSQGQFTVWTEKMPEGVCSLVKGQLMTNSKQSNWTTVDDQPGTPCSGLRFTLNPSSTGSN